MARNMYGCTSADFTLTESGRVVAGATATVWTARTGGTQITDLTDLDGDAITSVTSDADGGIRFYGVDGDKDAYWLDTGTGTRIAVRPVNLTGETGATPSLSIGTVGTGAAAASLTGTSEAPVLNLTLPSAGTDGVNTAAIQAKAVTAAKIADDTITATQIAANAVGTSELADNAVDTAAIQDSAVTSAKIADGTIVSGDVAASTFAAFGTVGSLLTSDQAGGYSGWSSDGTVDYWGGGDFAITSAWSYVFSSTRYAVTAGDTVTIQAELQPVGAGAHVVTQFFTALEGGDAVGGERYGNTVPAGGNALSTLTTVVPATATAMAFLIYGGTSALHVRHPGIWKGAGGTWALPGTPIVGQSRIAVNNAVDLSGTGTPEGVITAAPGSTWLQTDSTTDVKGWIRWVKATGTGNTGWVAGPEADTGWRDVSSLLVNSWTGAFYLRRQGDHVTLRFVSSSPGGSGAVLTFPAGFRIGSKANGYSLVLKAAPADDTDAGSYYKVSDHTFNIFNWDSYASAVEFPFTSYGDPWPSSLPGSAA